MYMMSKKAGKLWGKILDQAIDKSIDEDVHEGMVVACKLDSFEASTRAGNLLTEYFPPKAENLTFFFDPDDGMYGYYTILDEESLIAAMQKVATKHKLKATA